jgi:hypothetical protein
MKSIRDKGTSWRQYRDLLSRIHCLGGLYRVMGEAD